MKSDKVKDLKTISILNIEVAFATPEKQKIIKLIVKNTTSVFEAITQSNIALEFPTYSFTPDTPNLNIGIFGKKIDPQTYKLKPNDRIEIYRPLNKSPNQNRLERIKLNDNK